jgi:DNA-binding response OmpR family regulator
MARILVVHHDFTQIVLFKNVLTRHNYEVVCASDYRTAVEAAQQSRIHLAFFSVWLSGITGIDLAHTLRTLDPTLPLVVFLSLYDLHRSRLDALHVKSIIRPFDPNKIIKTVRMYIRPDIDAHA